MLNGASVIRLLMALQWVMAVAILAFSLVVAVVAWKQDVKARDIERLTRLDKVLFDSLLAVRAPIPRVQTSLLTDEDSHSVVDQARRVVAEGYDDARIAVTESELAGSDRLLEDLAARWSALDHTWPEVERQGRRPRGERDVAATQPWRQAIRDATASLAAASSYIANAVRMLDPQVAEMILFRQTAMVVRLSFGNQCSLLRPDIAANRVPEESTTAEWNASKGAYDAAWQLMAEQISHPNAPSDLVVAVTAARSATQSAQSRIDEIVRQVGRNDQPPVPSAEWTRLCNGPFEPILAIGQLTLAKSMEHASTQQAAARRLMMVAGLGLAFSLLLAAGGIVLIRRRLSLPLKRLMTCVAVLARRDFGQPVPMFAHGDELSRMAAALEELRVGAQDAERLEAEAAARNAGELARAGDLKRRCEDFRAMAATTMVQNESSLDTLSDAARSMKALAVGSLQRASLVSAGADEAAANIQTVAAATEELSASIREISARAAASASSARAAVSQAEVTNLTVEAMADSVRKIGEVAGLISDIASQTNLLALNATIEAARAGEAGKGFAVVAGEVKNLANQTARATEEISGLISDIQRTTREAAQAIRLTTDTITVIDESSTAIAAAVEEQGVATSEIAGNINQVAQGTQTVTDNISAVARGSHETDAAAGVVMEAVESTRMNQAQFRLVVDDFLASVQQV